jgi:hypothetical protein
MAERTASGKPEAPAVLSDFLHLGAKAFVSGIVVALVLGFAALVLAGNADAAPNAPTYGKEPRSAAPTPDRSKDPAGVGALWARGTIAPDTVDTPAMLQLPLGLLALGAAALVAVIGRGHAQRNRT